MNALERLARAAASGDQTSLTRRDLAARGLLGLLALGVSSRLAAPDAAFAAATPCKSLKTCLNSAEAAATNAYEACLKKFPYESVGSNPGLGCRLWHYQPTARKAMRECLEKCPPPPKGPRPKKPPRHAPPPPPPLPPNPYAPISDACASCTAVGGMCCWGSDPKALCACANPAYDCASRYGCG